MSETMIIDVGVDPSWDADTRVQLYRDNGTGTVDFGVGLMAVPAAVLQGLPSVVLGENTLGINTLGDNLPATRSDDPAGNMTLGTTPLGGSLPTHSIAVDLDSIYRLEKFAIKAIDRHGTFQTDAAVVTSVFVSGTDPDPMNDFSFVSYDAQTDRVRFSIS